MENILIEENQDIHTKEINGEICLYYKPTYRGQNILNDIKFKTWLNEQEKLKGKNKLLFKCNSCNFIFYLKDMRDMESIKCCEKPGVSFWFICTYCGDNFTYDQFCCKRMGFKWELASTFLNGNYFCNAYKLLDQIKVMPLFFHVLFVFIFFETLFYLTKMKLKNSGCSETPLIGIGIIFSIVQGFTYFFPFLIIYFIYFIIALTGFKLNRCN